MDPAQAKELEMHAGERAINAAINLGDSEVQRFYKGTTILITGGTGFIGKQLTEKLFRSCDVKKAFLLMRPRKGKTIQARLEKLLEDPVFDSVKKMRPGFEKKLCPVFGDVSDLGLGIQNEDYVDIINETDIIIHGAASINFEEPFKAAVNTNVRGTVEMLNLGKQCKKLKSFVYVSTAFTHAVESRIKTAVHEEFYEPGLTPQVAIEMAATIEEKLLNEITPKLTQNWRNVYIFTKAIAEEAVRQAKDLPICIVRPAVVIASYQEPAPGWMDMSSALGVSGFIMGVGFGLLHSMHIDLKVQLNLVPVDLVNNAIIVAGWTTATRHERGEVPKIYTVNNNRNPVTWRMAWENFDAMKERYCSPLQNYYNFSHNTSHRMIYVFLNWLWHYIPGYILDFVFLVMGKKPMAVKLYTRAHKVTSVFSFFMTNDWLFTDENLVAMFNSLNQTDRKIYNCDMASVNTFDMYTAWILGVRKYIKKDGLQGTEYGLKKQFWFGVLHYTVVLPIYFSLLFMVAMLVFTVFSYCWALGSSVISWILVK